MAAPFLYLNIDKKGIRARVVRDSRQWEWISIAFDDLPPGEEASEPGNPDLGFYQFNLCMEMIAERLDITQCRSSVVLISDQWISFRNISLPFSNPKKIQQVLNLELAPGLPLSGIDYDAAFILTKEKFLNDHHLILAGAWPSPLLADLTSAVKNHKIPPRAIAPMGYAHACGFLSSHPELRDFIFIHTQGRELALTLISQKAPVLARVLSGNQIRPDALARRIHQTLLGFYHRSGTAPGFDVYITAPEPDGNALETALKQVFSRETDIVPPRVIALEPKEPPITPENQPDFLLNLSDSPAGYGSVFQEHRAQLIWVACLALVVFFLSFANIQREILQLEDQVAMEQEAARSIYQQTFPNKTAPENLSPLLLMQSNVNQVLKAGPAQGTGNKETLMQGPGALRIIHELSAGIPVTIDAELSRMILNRSQLVISGSTDNFNHVDQIKGGLEKSSLFKTVTISSAEADKSKSSILFKFIITL